MNYSAIDSKMVKKLTARFKYFGEKIYGEIVVTLARGAYRSSLNSPDANWSAEKFQRDAICRDLVEREASGRGVMDEPAETTANSTGSGAFAGPVAGPSHVSVPPIIPEPTPGPTLAPAPGTRPAPAPASTLAQQPAPAPPPALTPQPAPTRQLAAPAPQRTPASTLATEPTSGQQAAPAPAQAPALQPAPAEQPSQVQLPERDRQPTSSPPVSRPSIPPQIAPRPRPVHKNAPDDPSRASNLSIGGSTEADSQPLLHPGISAFRQYDPREGLEMMPLQEVRYVHDSWGSVALG